MGSKLLVLGFSVAVAFMVGWLALTLILRSSESTIVVADDEVPAMATKQPPRVAAPLAGSRPLVAAPKLLSPQADPVAPTAALPATDSSPASRQVSPMALASLPPTPVVTAPQTVPAGQPPTASLSATTRLAVGDIYAQVTNKIAEDDPVDASDVIPLPPRRPHLTSVPFPRPRPQIAQQETQARAEPTLMDFLTGGWR